MDVLKARIPTKRETWLLFLGCVLLIHIRAYLVFFNQFPSLILYMTAGKVLGFFAYVQVFALFCVGLSKDVVQISVVCFGSSRRQYVRSDHLNRRPSRLVVLSTTPDK